MRLVQRAFYLVAALLFSIGIGAAPALAATSSASEIAIPLPAPAPAAITPPPLLQVQSQPASQPTFASLAAAVAAQDGMVDSEHLRCLASAIYFESQGQPLAGQLAVAQVILNRIRSGRFASDICGVVLQRGQFGFVRGGQIPTIPTTRAAFRTAIAVAKVAMSSAWSSVIGNALYFNGVRAGHSGSKRVAVIGGHAFYR